ncbi:hypothetical protein A3C21_01000 [Candidatus Kaiserbacteria bacterium RIFCSPHIGHO2_02_FULL_59_21]|uniref:EamA domain-containing protein n=1 Tax=Candidatus Kaiserbacteria bacterium RIFCSPHIGHO2_02_FULL_59_21 TaxID=1798500 RepID=A0A1F6E0K0_9BACT|nr:MAG: hypothetical protein A3C21_01000 [Candidatus Kaiserbacteria bacterium RIFCSPHIGHO2_02_FULL_59_21]OGG79700.1 MAG: hypothetical protein A2952_01125 [Candidatus Kaiserbacteria bacterium RIFCSPLOWO2_01_FULL_59_34]OGG87018.1 MAG: hypothetical protein A3I47_03335 [Candidatus Kaiserbacteria bacterium RIFCSPLOWO2_02_FULL_59_19]
MWLELSLVSAVLLGVRRIYEKQLTATFGNFSLSFLTLVFALPPALALLLFFPIPEDIAHLPWRFWWPLLVIWLVLYPIQNYFLFRSLREGELSAVLPISALLPVFNLATSYAILGEGPSALGIAGIASIAGGTYLLLFGGRVGAFTLNRPVLFMLISIACTALGSTLDKVSVGVSTPVFYGFVNMLGASAVFLVLAAASGQAGELRRVGEAFWTLVALGVILALAVAAFMAAFQEGPTSYVLALRSGGFFLPVVWGFIVLKESVTPRKALALALFSAGVALLAL